MKSLNIVFSSLTSPLSSEVQYKAPVFIKGATTVNFILSSFINSPFPVTNIAISWGDNTSIVYQSREIFYDYRTAPIIEEVLFGRLGGDILYGFQHNFINDTQSYGVQYNTEIVITRLNGTTVTVFTPIIVFWDSYYDTIKDLRVLNTQVHPISSNLTFTNLEATQDKIVLPAILDTKSTVLKTYQ